MRCARSARRGRPLCLFGHTHLPVVFHYENEVFDGFVPAPDEETTVVLRPEARYLVNVGSVGQPRDGDPRSAFGVYDSDALLLTLRRIVYPVEAAQRRILDAGLAGEPGESAGSGTVAGRS